MATLIVFSHPNHELAVFGLVQRLKPYLIYLTDGGGEERIAQTRRGLRSIGLLDRAFFLNHPEQSFYDALLARDSGFYRKVSDQVHVFFETLRPEQILCDAIEFYNPVHDMSLPITRAALRGLGGAPIFEVPLIHQKAEEGEAYSVQRMPASRRSGQIELRLSDEELAAKLCARDHIYTILVGQIGSVVSDLPPVHVALEVLAPACLSIPEHGTDVVLRYEWRAQMLTENGKIDRKITYHQHYLPIASSLLDS